MNILSLTLKKQWFNLILSGEKTEEYREIKPYWNVRLKKNYDVIRFRNGYISTSPWFMIQYKGFYCGNGRPEWGAPKNQRVYILKLGKIIHCKEDNNAFS